MSATPESYKDMVLFAKSGAKAFFFDDAIVEDAGDVIVVSIAAVDTEGSAYLETLRDAKPLGLAFRASALIVKLANATRTAKQGADSWRLTLQRISLGAGPLTEMAFNGFSVDKLAELRARRILLDEKLPEDPHQPDDINRHMLELFVRGWNTPMKTVGSPFPGLFAEFGSDTALFVAVARLMATLLLVLTQTVERITLFDLRLAGPQELSVKFSGIRHQVYLNAEPATISVEGRCRLAAAVNA